MARPSTGKAANMTRTDSSDCSFDPRMLNMNISGGEPNVSVCLAIFWKLGIRGLKKNFIFVENRSVAMIAKFFKRMIT